ncbi:uncharacterized protein LOC106672248 isoform X2 [Cimex lectularius]|uniref:Uncharacterized protein n=1 Tax=Cimex lectularius TaxID=79782 RepID=A0A8I6S761_CIMLE|nr:uncharacterized protein LOC106672248 isoform X2 [Cimex lectularius]
MNGAGRGRNRPVIVPPEILNAPLRRPGGGTGDSFQSAQPFNSKPEYKMMHISTPPSPMGRPADLKLSQMLSKLDLIFAGKIEDLVIYRVLSVYFKEADSQIYFDAMMEAIFKNMLLDPSNAVPICKYLYILSRDQSKGHSIRSTFYKYLQNYYNDKYTIWKNQGNDCFKNFVNFFAAATHHNRNVFIAPFHELVNAILEFAFILSSCLDSYAEIKLYSLLVIRYSQYTSMPNSKEEIPDINVNMQKFQEVKNAARLKLSRGTCKDPKSTLWLMMVLESNCSHPVAQTFYTEGLGKEDVNNFQTDVLNIQLPREDFKMFDISHIESILTLV